MFWKFKITNFLSKFDTPVPLNSLLFGIAPSLSTAARDRPTWEWLPRFPTEWVYHNTDTFLGQCAAAWHRHGACCASKLIVNLLFKIAHRFHHDSASFVFQFCIACVYGRGSCTMASVVLLLRSPVFIGAFRTIRLYWTSKNVYLWASSYSFTVVLGL